MPHTEVDGIHLYYEVTGDGPAVVFVHEFGGDLRSWEPQVRFLSRFFTCVTFNARGYPPSDVPDDPTAYGQEIFTRDIAAILAALKIARAHVVGLFAGRGCGSSRKPATPSTPRNRPCSTRPC